MQKHVPMALHLHQFLHMAVADTYYRQVDSVTARQILVVPAHICLQLTQQTEMLLLWLLAGVPKLCRGCSYRCFGNLLKRIITAAQQQQ